MNNFRSDTAIPGFTLDNLIEGYQLIGYDWKYIYVNKTVVKHSKYSDAADLIGYTMMEKFPGIENTRLFEILRQCMTERIATVMENEFTFPDGTIGFFDLRIEPVPQGLFILSMDVTERKKAQIERNTYINALEHILNVTSNCLKEPAESILELSKSLSTDNMSPAQLQTIASDLKNSAVQLKTCRDEIATLISATSR
jgi:hypothetical protein